MMRLLRCGLTLLIASFCLIGSAWGAPSLLGTSISTGVLGDLNSDGIANSADLTLFQANMGKAGGVAQGDYNNDGIVNSSDLTIFNAHLNRSKAPAYFARILDTTTAFPTGTGKFANISSPMLDRTLRIAFAADNGVTDLANPRYGNYAYNAGAISRVVDSASTIPSGTGAFSFVAAPTISGSKIFFSGSGDSGDSGIYTYDLKNTGAGIGVLVRSKTRTSFVSSTNPNAPPASLPDYYAALGDPDGSATTFDFYAKYQQFVRWDKYYDATNKFLGFVSVYTPEREGVMAYSGTTNSMFVDTTTVMPGTANAKFTTFDSATVDGSTHWFIGVGKDTSLNQVTKGIYKLASGGTLTRVLDTSMTFPGSTSKYDSFSYLRVEGNTLVFQASVNNRNGIYALVGDTIQRIAEAGSTLVPEGSGAFTSFGLISVGNGSAAFVGYDSTGRSGIFSWINGHLERIIDTSTILGGKVISRLEIGNFATVSNKILFQAYFSDNTTGLYTASLVGSPTAGDVNGDNKVDSRDYDIIQANLGKAGYHGSGDLDGDGMVTVSDVQIYQRNFGHADGMLLRGDLDGDRKVDSADAAILRANFGKYGSIAQGDIDFDGLITLSDWQLMQNAWGQTATAWDPYGAVLAPSEAMGMMSVPEPGMLGLFGASVVLLLRRNRRA